MLGVIRCFAVGVFSDWSNGRCVALIGAITTGLGPEAQTHPM
jgi:hypothetical protein